VLGDPAAAVDGAGVYLGGAAAAFDGAGLLADSAAAQHRGFLEGRARLGAAVAALDRSLAGLTPVVARPFSPSFFPVLWVLLVVVVVVL
jgi:hypothetical protein